MLIKSAVYRYQTNDIGSELRHNMGLAGRKRVAEYFDLRTKCAKLESIYDKLL